MGERLLIKCSKWTVTSILEGRELSMVERGQSASFMPHLCQIRGDYSRCWPGSASLFWICRNEAVAAVGLPTRLVTSQTPGPTRPQVILSPHRPSSAPLFTVDTGTQRVPVACPESPSRAVTE